MSHNGDRRLLSTIRETIEICSHVVPGQEDEESIKHDVDPDKDKSVKDPPSNSHELQHHSSSAPHQGALRSNREKHDIKKKLGSKEKVYGSGIQDTELANVAKTIPLTERDLQELCAREQERITMGQTLEGWFYWSPTQIKLRILSKNSHEQQGCFSADSEFTKGAKFVESAIGSPTNSTRRGGFCLSSYIELQWPFVMPWSWWCNMMCSPLPLPSPKSFLSCRLSSDNCVPSFLSIHSCGSAAGSICTSSVHFMLMIYSIFDLCFQTAGT